MSASVIAISASTSDYIGIFGHLKNEVAVVSREHSRQERIALVIDHDDEVRADIIDRGAPPAQDQVEVDLGGDKQSVTLTSDDQDKLNEDLRPGGALAVLIDRVLAGSAGDQQARKYYTDDAHDALQELLGALSADRYPEQVYCTIADVWSAARWLEPTMDDTLRELGLDGLDTADVDDDQAAELVREAAGDDVHLVDGASGVRDALESAIRERRKERLSELESGASSVEDVLELLQLADEWELSGEVDTTDLPTFGPDPRDVEGDVADEVVSWEWDGESTTCPVIPIDGAGWRIEEVEVVPDDDPDGGGEDEGEPLTLYVVSEGDVLPAVDSDQVAWGWRGDKRTAALVDGADSRECVLAVAADAEGVLRAAGRYDRDEVEVEPAVVELDGEDVAAEAVVDESGDDDERASD